MGQLLPLIIRIACSYFLAQTLDDIAFWGVSFHIPGSLQVMKNYLTWKTMT